MRKLLLISGIIGLLASQLYAQMRNGRDTLYGNEWIRQEQNYLRLPVTEDGVYRVSFQALNEAGWPLDRIASGQWRLYKSGEEEALYVSTNGLLQTGDYLEFFGRRNRGEMDAHLYEQPSVMQLNPAYSLITDTTAYFLTWTETADGRRYEQTNNSLPTALPAQPYLFVTSEHVFNQAFLKEYYRQQGVTLHYSHFSVAEGYGSRSINDFLADGGTQQQQVIPTPNLYGGGPAARLETRFAGGLDDHQQVIRINGQQVHQSNFTAWRVENVSTEVSGLSGENQTISWQGMANSRDEVSIAYARLLYPMLPTAGGQPYLRFQLAGSNDDLHLSIDNWPATAGTPVVYDLTNLLRLEAVLTDGRLQLVLPAYALTREVVIVGAEQGWRDLVPQPASFSPLIEEQVDYVILTQNALRGPEDPVAAYADYRRSQAGGGYRVAVVDVEQVYEQFGYGLRRHPQGIRNFIHWLKKTHPTFKHLFLIGKGREYIFYRQGSNLNAIAGKTFFVPAFGYPASDQLLASTNQTATPIISIGRLSATSAADVALYLDKVKGLEANEETDQTLESKAWMKNIIHLGGGGDPVEQQTIRASLTHNEQYIEGSTFGANVSAFYKTNTEPIQISQSERIFELINEGVSLITFFGHSGSNTFDFNIDNPDNYDNEGKYPLMLSLGCYSGDIFQDFRSIGERFVFQPNSGAIAFGASRGVGFIYALSTLSGRFYQRFGTQNYGLTIGECLRLALSEIDPFQDIGYVVLSEQFSYLGDPALRLNPAPGPDFLADPAGATFDPTITSVQRDSFEFAIDLYNIGRKTEDSLRVAISQSLPGGQRQELGQWTIASPAYRTRFTVRLPTLGRASVGQNTLHLRLDPNNQIAELPAPAAESNNDLRRTNGELGIPFYIVDNAAIPVSPPDYGLVGKSPVTLQASTADALAKEQTYILELDTVPSFEQPLARTEITQGGGIIRWSPAVNWRDSMAYYWRISPDSLPGSPGFAWEMSSFIYVNGSAPGWGQTHWGQWQEGEFDNTLIDPSKDRWNFSRSYNDIRIKNNVYNRIDPPLFIFNGQHFASPWPWILRDGGIQMIVIDSINGFWMLNPPGGGFGSVSTNDYQDVWGYDTRTQQGRQAMMNFIENHIPAGKYVMLYSAQYSAAADYGAANWLDDEQTLGKTIFDVLEAEGATQVRQLATTGSVPYVFMFQKGIGPMAEAVATNINETIYAEASTGFNWPRGRWDSEAAGRAREWRELQFRFDTAFVSSSDSIYFRLYGYEQADGMPTVLREMPLPLQPPAPFTIDLSDIDAGDFPYLSASFEYFDQERRSMPQLAHLYFLYEAYPDAAVDAAKLYSFRSDTLERGREMELRFGYTNPSDFAFDSLLIKYTLTLGANEVAQVYQRKAPLAAGESGEATITLPTDQLSGAGQLSVTLNADNDQAEELKINNFLVQPFFIVGDRVDPQLLVTFDGRRIMDGDLVSSRPTILLTLEDDNRYLLLQDTSLFRLSIRHPDGREERIGFNDPRLTFTPAEDADRNRATVLLQPAFEESGRYELLVQGEDVSGNRSGELDFRVSFEVITERMVANVFNYPNPFTTQTQFVYTLTGDVPPAEFRIQIMTVSGRVVRDIDLAGMEPLRIGTHRTNYVWDGTDEYGDRLANGVYLYRIIVRDESGKELQHYQNGTDQYFKNGLGKLVILR